MSDQCNGHGHLVCGECSCCGDVFFGPTCNCTRNNDEGSDIDVDPHDLEATCRPPGAKTSVPVCRLGLIIKDFSCFDGYFPWFLHS